MGLSIALFIVVILVLGGIRLFIFNDRLGEMRANQSKLKKKVEKVLKKKDLS